MPAFSSVRPTADRRHRGRRHGTAASGFSMPKYPPARERIPPARPRRRRERVAEKRQPVFCFSNLRCQEFGVGRVNADERDTL